MDILIHSFQCKYLQISIEFKYNQRDFSNWSEEMNDCSQYEYFNWWTQLQQYTSYVELKVRGSIT
jgi:hypothetical protein